MRPLLLLSYILVTLHTTAAQRSLWDIILGVDRSYDSTENRVETNVLPSTLKSSLKAAQSEATFSTTTRSTTTTTRPTTTTTARPTTTTTVATTTKETTRGKRKIIVNLMDVYHCPTTGVFPIDGDCSRFLMCRQGREGRGLGGRSRGQEAGGRRQGRVLGGRRQKIRGKVYRCPTGYLFSNSRARCKPESKVACHRSNPLQRFRQAYNIKPFLMP